MPDNTFSYHGPGERWVEQEPTAEDLLNVARENNDHLYEALNNFISSTNYLSGFVATYTNPFILNAGANLFWSFWIDNTDPNDIILRSLMGTTRASVVPGSINDTSSFCVQLFQRNAGSPPP